MLHRDKRGPKEKGPTGKTHAGRIALRVGASLLSIVFLTAGCGILYVRGLLKSIDRTEFTGDPTASFDETLHLHSGTDWAASSGASSGVTVEQNASNISAAHGGFDAVQQIKPFSDSEIQNILLIGCDKSNFSDSTMIVSINHRTGKIHITSLMRAMYVKIPGYGWFLFNHAYSNGGAKLLIQTIEDNFRVKIDDYVSVNFSTFPKVIDVLGGVTINLSRAEASKIPGATAGDCLLNGQQALTYSRIRYIDNDFNRTSRQRKVIEALIRKASSSGLLTLNQFATQLFPLINTSLSEGELLKLAVSAPKLIGYEISQKMLPVENDTTNGGAASFYGIMYIPAGPDTLEAYSVNFIKNVDELHRFIQE